MLRLTLLVCLVGLALGAPSTNKIERNLLRSLTISKGTENIFVKFQEGNAPALQRISKLRFSSRTSQINSLVAGLKSLTESSQKNALSLLKSRSPFSTFKQFWVSNELYIRGASAQLVQALATLPEVAEIRKERIFMLEEPTSPPSINAEWNIERVKAHEAWALPGGNNGQNAVVASIDTGVRRTHESLRNNYRADHGWFDPYDGTSEPNDGNGHGTHTVGIMVGSGGIGMAPSAQWIACKGCGSISCSTSALLACGQWTLCPTDANGQNEDCSKAPNVVSNSWGGGQGDDFFNGVIDAWKAVNIVPVFAIGNSGPSCGTASSPGDQDVIAVGSITSSDMISGSSSAGPSVGGIIKPDIAAPGQSVRSAWSSGDDAYNTISGTSMACPHVSGAAALLFSSNPNLTYDEVKRILTENADKDVPDTGRVCGGIPSTQIPNNQYGYGILNARRALEAVIG